MRPIAEEYRCAYMAAGKPNPRASSTTKRWQGLNDAEYNAIGYALLENIKPGLRKTLQVTINSSVPVKHRK